MLVGSGVLMAMKKGRGPPIAVAAVEPRDHGMRLAALDHVLGLRGVGGEKGVTCACFNGPMMTLIQRYVPEEKLGRALGLFTALTGVAAPVGVPAGGPLAEAMWVAPFFVVDGLSCLGLGCQLLLFSQHPNPQPTI